MSTVASILVPAIGIYAVIGISFAIVFQVRGLRNVDPAAADGSLAFKLLIFPGCVALWPLLARNWRRGSPLSERNAHRAAAAREIDRHGRVEQ